MTAGEERTLELNEYGMELGGDAHLSVPPFKERLPGRVVTGYRSGKAAGVGSHDQIVVGI